MDKNNIVIFIMALILLLVIAGIGLRIYYTFRLVSAIIGGNDDTFPYTRQWHSDEQIHQMMNNLRNYDGMSRLSKRRYDVRNLKGIDLTYNGEHIMIINKPKDYKDFNMLSDMFMEECRMKCSVKGKQSPHQYYTENKVMLDSKYSANELRDEIWKRSHECTSHRPNILSTMIQLYKAKSVLDPTSGWGDRLLSAIASNVEYCGIDNNPCLLNNYNKIIAFFGCDKNKYVMIQSDTLTATIPDRQYDLIFTSPPYFDFELYSGELEHNERKWYDTFLKPCLTKYWDRLIVGGHMCININQLSSDQHYVSWMLGDCSILHSSKYKGVISYAEEPKFKNPQPIWIWEKIGPKIRYRTFTMSDVSRMSDIFGKKNNMENIAAGKTLTYQETKDRIQKFIDEEYSMYPIIYNDNGTDTIVGMIGHIDGGYLNKKWKGKKCIRIVVDEEYRRLGIAKEIISQYTRTGEFYSLVGTWNIPKNALSQKMGFKLLSTERIHGKEYNMYRI
jgi:RimJ/RimL family protein N-acetyltransferase